MEEIVPSCLDKLRVLTEDLPSLDDFFTGESSRGDWVEYDFKEEGIALQFGLFHNPEVAVSRAFLAGGTCFPGHVHQAADEVVIVVAGKFLHRIWNGDGIEETKELSDHEIVFIPKGTFHAANCPVNTWVIATTLPADPSYPGGPTLDG